MYTHEGSAVDNKWQESSTKPRKRWEDAVQEEPIKLLRTKKWKTKAKDRQLCSKCIVEAKARYGM
jgi:hypothetical protein